MKLLFRQKNCSAKNSRAPNISSNFICELQKSIELSKFGERERQRGREREGVGDRETEEERQRDRERETERGREREREKERAFPVMHPSSFYSISFKVLRKYWNIFCAA